MDNLCTSGARNVCETSAHNVCYEEAHSNLCTGSGSVNGCLGETERSNVCETEWSNRCDQGAQNWCDGHLAVQDTSG
jgi:hypothetical protein